MVTSGESIPATFVRYAADILGNTNEGLSGAVIVQLTCAYGVDFGVDVKHTDYPFDAPNKRTALYENLMCFEDDRQKYKIIRELCEHDKFRGAECEEINDLKVRLSKYSKFSGLVDLRRADQELISEVRHWLEIIPDALTVYNDAIAKIDIDAYSRNLLDDLRLCLEITLRNVLENHKSLENQLPSLGVFVKSSGGSSEFTNMINRLLDYYSKYQNEYVKHSDTVNEIEANFVFELTSVFIKQLVRLKYP
jgi:hypothetical protein